MFETSFALTLVEDCKRVHERDYCLLGIDNRIGIDNSLYLSEKLNQINIH